MKKSHSPLLIEERACCGGHEGKHESTSQGLEGGIEAGVPPKPGLLLQPFHHHRQNGHSRGCHDDTGYHYLRDALRSCQLMNGI